MFCFVGGVFDWNKNLNKKTLKIIVLNINNIWKKKFKLNLNVYLTHKYNINY